MTPDESDYQQCSYCSEWYFAPVSYHHTEEECLQNQSKQQEETQ